jgi:hypothetical protein
MLVGDRNDDLQRPFRYLADVVAGLWLFEFAGPLPVPASGISGIGEGHDQSKGDGPRKHLRGNCVKHEDARDR